MKNTVVMGIDHMDTVKTGSEWMVSGQAKNERMDGGGQNETTRAQVNDVFGGAIFDRVWFRVRVQQSARGETVRSPTRT